MIIFKPYTNIKDFLYRFTILKLGNLHIRLHKIVDKDQSSFYHNHPFHYISLILNGGYTESYICPKTNIIKTKTYRFGSIIIRKQSVFHRIVELKNNKKVITLFFAYGNYGWKAFNTEEITSNDGIFERIINGKTLWAKKENDIWFIGNINKEKAIKETRHSIHQIL